jgi:hypothetical protein
VFSINAVDGIPRVVICHARIICGSGSAKPGFGFRVAIVSHCHLTGGLKSSVDILKRHEVILTSNQPELAAVSHSEAFQGLQP